MRSRKLLALIFSLLAIAPALAGYMTLLGAGVGSIQPVASWVSTTDPTFPSSSLTFSRTSLATMFDSTGKLTYAPNNLLTYSNTFSNPAWAKISVTVTGGVSDPFGGTNAFTVKANSSGGNSFIYQYVTGIAGMNLLETVWIRRRTGTGAVNFFANNGITGTAIPVTGTWQQLTNVVVGLATTSVGFILATINDEIDIYAATASVVTYETASRSNDQVITTSAAYYGPRIDYDPNTLAVKGLLIEEARTWVALWNRDLTNAVWVKTSITAVKNQTGIDGVANSASSITATSANGTILQNITLASSQRLQSAYVKRIAGSGAVSMTTDGGATWTTITVTGSWAQQTIPAQTLANPSAGFKLATSGDAIAVDFVGNELGAFVTSALQTGASSVTRAPDVVQFTGAALSALQGSAGSVIVQSISEASSSPAAITNVIKGTNSILYRDTTGKTGTTNGTTALLTAAAPTWSSAIRNGLAWSVFGRSLGYTSSAIATDANAVSNSGTLYLGSSTGSAVESGWYQSFGIWDQRLSDATLSTKLTVGGSYAANDNINPFAPQFAANDNFPVH